MIPQRTCVACDMSKPWRDMVNWTKDPELEKRWTQALTPNDDEKHVLELRLAGDKADNKPIYVCESHFNRENSFKLTPSGWALRTNAMPEDVRKLFNDSSSQNAPSGSNNDMPPPSPFSQPLVQPTSPSRKRSAPTLKSTLDEMMPQPKMMPPPPNTIDITGTTTEMMMNGGMTGAGGGQMGGTANQLVNMGGGVGATVKIEVRKEPKKSTGEIENDEQLTWVNSVIPLETPEERENRIHAERAAEQAAADATAAAALAFVAADVQQLQQQPAVDTVDDCINSVIRQSLEPPVQPTSELLKPKLSYETLCYEAFEFIRENFQQTDLKMSDICHYISHKYRYFATGIMWRKQVFRALNTSDYITVVRLDKPENKEDDSLYSLNKTEYDYRIGADGEVRVRWRKKNKNPTQQPNHSLVDNDEERRRMNNRAIPEASDDVALFNAIAGSLGVPQTMG